MQSIGTGTEKGQTARSIMAGHGYKVGTRKGKGQTARNIYSLQRRKALTNKQLT